MSELKDFEVKRCITELQSVIDANYEIVCYVQYVLMNYTHLQIYIILVNIQLILIHIL